MLLPDAGLAPVSAPDDHRTPASPQHLLIPPYPPPGPVLLQRDFTGGSRKYTDGAGSDDPALMPLLRRGVRNIIMGVPTKHLVAGTTARQFAFRAWLAAWAQGWLHVRAHQAFGDRHHRQAACIPCMPGWPLHPSAMQP